MKKLNKDRAIKLVLLLIVFSLPFLFTLGYVLYCSDNIAFADDFRLIDSTIQPYYEGDLTWSDLWAPDNQMRLVIYKFILILSAEFTDLNVQILMCVSLSLILGYAILIYRYYKRTVNIKNQYLYYIAFFPVVLLLFSIRQWESLLYAMPLFMTLFFLVLSIVLMQKSLDKNAIDKYFFFSIISSVVATFSFSSGLLVWPLLIIQILLSGLNKAKVRKLLVYLTSAIVVMVVYLYNTSAVSHFGYFLGHLDRAAGFVLVNIGNSIIGEFANKPSVTIAFAFGVGLVFLYLFAIYIFIRSDTHTRKDVTFCILLIVFSLMCTVLTTVARLELAFENVGAGLAYAASSRYSTAGIIGVAGVYLFYLYYIVKYSSYAPAVKRFVSAFSILVALILLGYSMATIEESTVAPYRRIYYQHLINLAHSDIDKLTNEQLKAFNADNPQLVRDGLQFLKEKGLNVYKEGTERDSPTR